MTWLFLGLYAPVVALLGLIAFVVLRLCDRCARLQARCDAIDLVEPFMGQITWPVDEDILDSLRECAGDVDDARRRQLDTIIAMDARRH